MFSVRSFVQYKTKFDFITLACDIKGLTCVYVSRVTEMSYETENSFIQFRLKKVKLPPVILCYIIQLIIIGNLINFYVGTRHLPQFVQTLAKCTRQHPCLDVSLTLVTSFL